MVVEATLGGWHLSIRALRCWLTVYRRIWRASVWSSVLGPLFYLGALGYGLGSLVDKHGTGALGGVPYLAFVAPAILATQAMNSGMGEASFPVFGSVKWNKIYIAAQATPLRPADIFRGHLLFIGLRITMNSAIFIAFMALQPAQAQRAKVPLQSGPPSPCSDGSRSGCSPSAHSGVCTS